MPLIAHNKLPSFERLAQEGLKVLSPDVAIHQDIRELHIGLLNMMPDSALEATERQFFRLIGESTPVGQLYVHPFSLDVLPRGERARQHIATYYEPFEKLKEEGLDALIITGANVVGSNLPAEVFWEPFKKVADWAEQNVTSTLCSCLATHALLEYRYGQRRETQPQKKWGVFKHHVVESRHPLVEGINSRFDVPHSRWNTVYPQQYESAGLQILVKGDEGFVHLATSPDGFRSVLFQGHPESDSISLLKEYKREVGRFIRGETDSCGPLPDNYLDRFSQAICKEYDYLLNQALQKGEPIPEFPEALIANNIDNTWRDTATAVVGNWIGLIYAITNVERNKPFMDHIDPQNPLALAFLD